MTVSPEDLAMLSRQEVSIEVPKRVNPMIELGQTGLRRVSGYIDEEFLVQLKGRRAVQVFREMADNDPIIGSLIFAIDKLLREVSWSVEAASQTPQDKAAAEFLEQCMNDMSQPWSEFISEVLSMLIFGWSWHEIVYKRRVGPWETDARKRSLYTDGKIGWRKMPIRAQETLLQWVFDPNGGIQGMVQMAPPIYNRVVLPINKSLLFRVTTAKGNPEGRSLLRNAYRPWYLKKRMEEIEAIGVERDLAGLPIGKLPADYLAVNASKEKQEMVAAFKKMVRSVRRDEQEGILLPQAFDQDTKQPLFDFELLSSGGSRQFDTSGIIQRYEQRMLMSVLADFILVGHESVGSYSLHTDKTGLFRTAINSIAQAIADVLNRHAVPRLFAVNGMKLDELPKFRPSDVDPPDLLQLTQFMTGMAQVGVQWFPDPELEKFLRQTARLPELDDAAEQVREQEYAQSNVMRLAQQHLQAIQMQQQAAQGAYQIQQSQMGVEQQQYQMQRQPAVDQMQDQSQQMSLAQQQQQMQMNDPKAQQQAAASDQKNKERMAALEAAHKQRSAKQDHEMAGRKAKLDLTIAEQRHKQALRHRDEQHKQALRLAQKKPGQAAQTGLKQTKAEQPTKKAAVPPKGKK